MKYFQEEMVLILAGLLWIFIFIIYGYFLNDIEYFFEMLKGSPLKNSEIRLINFPFSVGIISFVFLGGISFHLIFQIIIKKEFENKFYYALSILMNIVFATIISNQFDIKYDEINKDLYQVMVWSLCNLWSFIMICLFYILHIITDREYKFISKN